MVSAEHLRKLFLLIWQPKCSHLSEENGIPEARRETTILLKGYSIAI